MKIKFRNQVSLVFLLVMVAMFICVDLFVGACLKPFLRYDLKLQMEDYGNQIEEMLVNGSEPEEIQSLIESFYVDYSIYFTVINSDTHKVEYHVDYKNNSKNKTTSSSDQRNRSLNTIIQEFRQQDENVYVTETKEDDSPFHRIWRVEKIDGYLVVMRASMAGMEQIAHIVYLSLVMITILSLIVGLIIWNSATIRFFKSLEYIIHATQQMAKMDFSKKLNYKGNIGEVQILADSIDVLSSELEQTLEEMQGDVDRNREMLRNLSHELKTPLTTIQGYTENIQILNQENSRIKKYTDIILEECGTINSLSTEMINFASLEKGLDIYEKKVIPVADVFDGFKDIVKREFPNDNMSLSFDETLIWGNENLLTRMLLNYYQNAIKYRTPDTIIQVKGEKLNDKDYRFSVLNYGKEISKSEQKRIWDVFYKVDKARKRDGSYGIGLAEVKRIADIHDGEVGVNSQNGKNTFWFICNINDIKETEK